MYLVVPPGGCFRETRRIELGARVLTLGRGEACDVRVDVPGVDDEHARISEVALIAIGADCAIGDVPLDPGQRRLVTPGDEIQIGSVVIALDGDDPNAPSIAEVHAAYASGRPHLETPRVRCVEGANFGDELLLKEENKEYVIGRHPQSDLVLEDREVSREHVRLFRRGFAVFIKDLGSTRGSWLGRSAVYTSGTVPWERPRMLRLGASVLSLELPGDFRRAHAPALASAPMTPEPRVRPGGVPLAVSSTPHLDPRGMSGRGSSSAPPPRGSDPPSSLVGPPRPVSPYAYDPTPPPAALGGIGLPQMPPIAGLPNMAGLAPLGGYGHGHAHGIPTPMPPSGASALSGPRSGAPSGPDAAISVVPSKPRSVPASKRSGWKKSGVIIGRGSGLLLLALAALAVLGALFVVFSLLE